MEYSDREWEHIDFSAFCDKITKEKREYAGTGRQARLRGVCFKSVWVQVPLLAPKENF